MAAKWQRVSIQIPKEYGPRERVAIAQDIVDLIVERTKDGKDKNNRAFKKYSEEYKDSLDFKIAGKTSQVDLTLSGDMLGALDLLSHKSGKIIIGYENGSEENARADGNIRGTYGHSKPITTGRDFLGITDRDLDRILKNYPVEDRSRTDLREASEDVAVSIVDQLFRVRE